MYDYVHDHGLIEERIGEAVKPEDAMAYFVNY